MFKTTKKIYPTAAQKSRLLALVQADEELQNHSTTLTKNIIEEKWKHITNELNSIPGARKEWTEWRKCWQDMKSNTKKKNAQLRQSRNSTGSGSSSPITTEDQEIINLINLTSLIEHTRSKESVMKKENRASSRRIVKNKPQKRLQETYNLAVKCKTALLEKNRLLKEKNDMQRSFFNQFLLQMQQQNDVLSRILDKLTNHTTTNS